jgi:hypothetical protein
MMRGHLGQMLRRSIIGITLTMGAVAQPALAECAGQYCFDVRISYLYTDGGGSSWISTTGNESLLGCTPDSGNLIRIDPTTLQSNWLYSSIMTAYVTNQTVTVRVADPPGTCTVLYMFMGTR